MSTTSGLGPWCDVPASNGDYQIALADYNAGLLPWPPCLRCCEPIPDAPFTGATLCDDCAAEAENSQPHDGDAS